MKPIRVCAAIVFALGLSACASVETASRGIFDPRPDLGPDLVMTQNGAQTAAAVQPGADGRNAEGPVALAPHYQVVSVRVVVPRDLKVSEANSFVPVADIVWRGEPRGDRHAQVLNIFEEAMAKGTDGLTDGRAVLVEVEVTRFHCLTEKTRYTVGGNHALQFLLTLRDAATGAVIDGPRLVIADVRASGGRAAFAEDQAGMTQRVVVVDRLAEVINRELAGPVTGAGADALLSSLESTVVPGQDVLPNEAGL